MSSFCYTIVKFVKRSREKMSVKRMNGSLQCYIPHPVKNPKFK
jgi:hypothetical protein